jgi:hypothetical protein
MCIPLRVINQGFLPKEFKERLWGVNAICRVDEGDGPLPMLRMFRMFKMFRMLRLSPCSSGEDGGYKVVVRIVVVNAKEEKQ